MEHRQPDRVPVGLRFVPEVEKKLSDHLGVEEAALHDLLGEDFVTVRPTFTDEVTDTKYADPTIEVTENGYLLDIWRVPFRIVENRFQTNVELAGNPPLKQCETISELENFRWPSADKWDYSNIQPELDGYSDKATWGHSRGFFEIACFLRGMDRFLLDLADTPELASSLMDRIVDYLLEKAKRALDQAGGRYLIFEYNDDVATQQGLLISPSMWRRHIKPRMARFCDLFRSYGTKVRYHCCGSCYEIIPGLIEIGVDVLNPIQPLAANMDPFKLKKEFGNDICLHGGVDTQRMLPRDSAETVYNHVCRLIEVVGHGGGYILGAGHRVQADTPVENILAMVEAATGAHLRGA